MFNLQKWINKPAQQPPNEEFAALATDDQIKHAVEALKKNGIEAFITENAAAAKAQIYQLIPEGAEVFTASSQTLAHLDGFLDELGGRYDSVREKLSKMDPKTQNREMIIMGAVPNYTVGSVHAVTETGTVMIASNTGSQLAGYVASAAHVVWVVSTKKIVPTIDEGLRRIYEYTYPMEENRVEKAYKNMHSNVSKLLLYNREVTPDRTKLIFVKENLGF